jgi:uncharacterized protein
VSATQIFTEIDFERTGKQVGWLYLPHSVTRSAYGNIAVPIAVIRNGSGPTVFFMAGTHGDEYEGQIALCNLIRSLDPGMVQGRIIAMPAANLPAALAGTRTSPIDDGNLNRAFPGDPTGTPTQQIAHFIDQIIFPLTNYYHDFHAGGASLDYVPFVSMRMSGDPALDERAMAALKACRPSDGLTWKYSHGQGFCVMAAMQRGIVALGGELGGGGSVNLCGVAMAERAIQGLLAHAGVVAPAIDKAPPASVPRLWEVPARSYYVLAPAAGLFQPVVELGAQVEAGMECGLVHFVDDPGRSPVSVEFRASGMVMAKRHLGRVERGDCVSHLATEWKG